MLTILFILVLIPVLVFMEITAQQRLFKHVAEKHDLEWELYQQRYD